MVDCRYSGKCWRRAYSEKWKQKRCWPNEHPPTRFELVLDGLATGEMAQTYKNKRGKMIHKGLFADKIPDNSGQGLCPAMVMQRKETCGVYLKAEEKRKKQNIGSKRIDVSKNTKKYIARRDKFYCYYCERHITELKALGIRGVIDHIHPQSLGGTNAESNLAYSCQQCNSDKGNDIWGKGCRKGYYAVQKMQGR